MLAIDDSADTRPTAALRRKARADGERSRQAAIAACRTLLTSGTCFRPTVDDLKAVGVSRKVLQRHFGTIGWLVHHALDDVTRAGILKMLMPNGPWPASDDCERIVRAVVVGRVT